MPIPLNAESIGRLSLHDSNKFHIQLGQTEERIRLISHWEIIEGEHILELGCGQGDCTAALASAVGEKGKVTAVDPAPLNYGKSIISLGQCKIMYADHFRRTMDSGRSSKSLDAVTHWKSYDFCRI